jgi:hypothetical protein
MSGFIPNRTCVQVLNLQDVDGVEQLLYVELRRMGVDVKAVVRLEDESYNEFGVTCSAYVYLWDAAREPHAMLANNLYGQRFSIFDDGRILKNNERVLYAKLVDARNLPAIVETLNVRQGLTFKALRRYGEQAITRRNERVFNGDNDDNNNELLAALRTEFERRANLDNTASTVNAANGTDVNNNNNNKDSKNNGDDDVNVNNNNNNNINKDKDGVNDNNNVGGPISGGDAGTDDDGSSESGESEVTIVPTSNASVPNNSKEQPLAQYTNNNSMPPAPSSSVTATMDATDDTTSPKPTSTSATATTNATVDPASPKPTSSSPTYNNNKSHSMMNKLYNSLKSNKKL